MRTVQEEVSHGQSGAGRSGAPDDGPRVRQYTSCLTRRRLVEQSYAQVQSFANQEAAKAAMNHMRWGLQAQVTLTPALGRPLPSPAPFGSETE